MSKNTNISELINYISYDGSGNIVFNTISAASTNTGKFLVSDAGTLKFRTATQLLSDIGAQASGSYQAALSGTGFVKISGSTISYDNSTYATQTYVTTAVSNLVAAAPSTLDTLNELATALGNDANFATTVATSIGTKQAQLNGTGFVKITGTIVSYDNSTYLTTSSASSTYVPYTGATSDLVLGANNFSSKRVSVLKSSDGYGGFTSNYLFLQTGSSTTTVGTDGISILSKPNTRALVINYDIGGTNYAATLDASLLTNGRTYNFPDASGTLALTSNIPTLSGYVPYTGATANLSLGNYELGAKYITSEGSSGLGGVVNIKQDAISMPKGNGYSSIAANLSSFDFWAYTGASTYKYFQLRFDGLTNGTTRLYTLPNADGTLALTSNLSSYLLLAGGTLTGSLVVPSPFTIKDTNPYIQWQNSSGTRLGYIQHATNLVMSADSGNIILTTASGSFTLASAGAATFNSSVTATYGYFSGTGFTSFNSQLTVNNTTSSPALITFQNTLNGHAFGFNSSGTQRFTFINGGLNEILSVTSAGVVTAEQQFRTKIGYQFYADGTAQGGIYPYKIWSGAGTDTTPTFAAEGNLGIYFCVNGQTSKVLTLASTGHLLVGSTSTDQTFWPSWDGGVIRIGQGGTIFHYRDSVVDFMIGGNYYISSSGAQETRIGTGGASNIYMENGNIRFRNAVSGAAGSAISWNTSLFLQTNGFVGVNTQTQWNYEKFGVQTSNSAGWSTIPSIMRLTNYISGGVTKITFTDSNIIDGWFGMVPVSGNSYFAMGFSGYTEQGFKVYQGGSVSINASSIGYANTKLQVNGTSTTDENAGTVFIQHSFSGSNGFGLAISRNGISAAALSLGADTSNNGIISANNTNLRLGKNQSGTFYEYLNINTNGNSVFSGNVLPVSDATYNLGSTSFRWNNVYTTDLHLSNEGKQNIVDGTWGDWTLQEGENDIFMLNNRNGEKFKIKLEKI